MQMNTRIYVMNNLDLSSLLKMVEEVITEASADVEFRDPMIAVRKHRKKREAEKKKEKAAEEKEAALERAAYKKHGQYFDIEQSRGAEKGGVKKALRTDPKVKDTAFKGAAKPSAEAPNLTRKPQYLAKKEEEAEKAAKIAAAKKAQEEEHALLDTGVKMAGLEAPFERVYTPEEREAFNRKLGAWLPDGTPWERFGYDPRELSPTEKLLRGIESVDPHDTEKTDSLESLDDHGIEVGDSSETMVKKFKAMSPKQKETLKKSTAVMGAKRKEALEKWEATPPEEKEQKIAKITKAKAAINSDKRSKPDRARWRGGGSCVHPACDEHLGLSTPGERKAGASWLSTESNPRMGYYDYKGDPLPDHGTRRATGWLGEDDPDYGSSVYVRVAPTRDNPGYYGGWVPEIFVDEKGNFSYEKCQSNRTCDDTMMDPAVETWFFLDDWERRDEAWKIAEKNCIEEFPPGHPDYLPGAQGVSDAREGSELEKCTNDWVAWSLGYDEEQIKQEKDEAWQRILKGPDYQPEPLGDLLRPSRPAEKLPEGNLINKTVKIGDLHLKTTPQILVIGLGIARKAFRLKASMAGATTAVVVKKAFFDKHGYLVLTATALGQTETTRMQRTKWEQLLKVLANSKAPKGKEAAKIKGRLWPLPPKPDLLFIRDN